MRRMLLMLITAMAVVGCSAPVAGSPGPVSAQAPSAEIALPPRPRELRLNGIDPCALLTPTQRGELGLSGQPLPGETDAPVFAGRNCSLTGYEPREIAVYVTLAAGNGIDQLISPDAVRDQFTPTTVSGFPAVVARPLADDFCSVDVDVAQGQFIDIQFRDAGEDPPIPQDQLCTDAAQVAAAVLTTLQSS